MGPFSQDEPQTQEPDRSAQDQALLKEAQEFLTFAYEDDKDNILAMADDLRMLSGDQWDPQAKAERESYSLPCLTYNRFPTYLAQITGEIRRNKPSVHCTVGDGDATRDMAEVFEGVWRSIERASDAQAVYANVGKGVSGGGVAHARLFQVFPDEDSFNAELRIGYIEDPFSVYWGESKRADKADAKKCLVVTEMTKAQFNKTYPNQSSATWAQERPFAQGDNCKWLTGDKVTVAEYWVVKEEPRKLVRIVNNKVWYDEFGRQRMPTGEETVLNDDNGPEEFMADLEEAINTGFSIIQEREAKRKKVCMYLLGGNAVLEGPIEWPGQRIPIFTCVGEEIHTGSKTVRHGLIRWVKDAQKVFNLARSIDLDLLGKAPKTPFLLDPEMIKGYEDIWNTIHRTPYPYAPYKAGPNGSKPERVDPLQQNTGPQAAAGVANDDLQAGMGIFNASLGQRSNETSGTAINARDAQSDTGTFVYIDNLNNMIAAMAQEAVNVIPVIYSTQKMIAIVGPDDVAGVVSIEQLEAQGQALDIGKYLIHCKPGPAYQTRREKAADRLAAMMQVAPPQFAPVIFEQLAQLDELPNNDEFIAKLQAVGIQTGVLPAPPQPQQPMPPEMAGQGPPGGPPMLPPPQAGAPLSDFEPPPELFPAPGPVVAAPEARPPGMGAQF